MLKNMVFAHRRGGAGLARRRRRDWRLRRARRCARRTGALSGFAGDTPYAQVPRVEAPHESGALDPLAVADALDYLNFLRALAGVEPVTVSRLYADRCQRGAVLLAAVDYASPRRAPACGHGRRLLPVRASGDDGVQRRALQLDAPGHPPRRPWRTSPATTARRTSRRSVHRRWLLDPAMAQDRLRPGELGDGHELRGDVRPRPRQRRRRVVRGLLALGGRLSRGADARRPGVVDLAQPRSLRPRALGHHRDARGGVARAALFVPLQRRHGRRLLHGQLRRLRLRSLRHLPPGLFAGGLHGLPAEPALDGARRGPRDRGRRAGASGIRRRDGVAVRAGRRRGGAERARAQPASR